jgi:hypothetical protein
VSLRIISVRVKKYKQAFLASLPVMDLKPPHLVITLRNGNTTDGLTIDVVVVFSQSHEKSS